MSDHQCEQEGRLGRMEKSLDAMQQVLEKLSELFINKAACDIRINQIEKLLIDFETRMRALEKCSNTNSGSIKWIERVAWCIVTAGVAAVMHK